MTMEDIRLEGRAARLLAIPTVVVVDGLGGKEYRIPTDVERQVAADTQGQLDDTFAQIPLGFIDEPTPAGGGSGASRAFSVQKYGMMRWRDPLLRDSSYRSVALSLQYERRPHFLEALSVHPIGQKLFMRICRLRWIDLWIS